MLGWAVYFVLCKEENRKINMTKIAFSDKIFAPPPPLDNNRFLPNIPIIPQKRLVCGYSGKLSRILPDFGKRYSKREAETS
jgi:hypothetical protein